MSALRQLLGHPAVELLRVLPHRGVAALLHVGEDGFDGLADLAVHLFGDFGGDAALQMDSHVDSKIGKPGSELGGKWGQINITGGAQLSVMLI